MQEYGRVFSEVYARRWVRFSAVLAPLLKSRFERTGPGPRARSVLDLCCGTGELCRYFLQNGYTAVGVDRSPHMLEQARTLNREHVAAGKARFVQADVAEYAAEAPCGLAVSLFDSLNHLDGLGPLERCFRNAFRGLLPGGLFIFDLNTAQGLKRWTGLDVQEDEEITLIRRGIYEEGMGRAYTQISGFIRREGGRYERFSEVFYNTVFDLAEVRGALVRSGFTPVQIVSAGDLEQPLERPEQAARAVFVAARPGGPGEAGGGEAGEGGR